MLRATRLKAEAKKTALGVKVEIYLIAYTTFVYMLFLFPVDVLCEYWFLRDIVYDTSKSSGMPESKIFMMDCFYLTLK